MGAPRLAAFARRGNVGSPVRSWDYGRISIGVPSGTAFQISSISSFVTAIQPSVQSLAWCEAPIQLYPFGKPCTNTSPPGEKPFARAAARSRAFGYEM